MIADHFKSSSPVFPSLDLDRSIEFYTRVFHTTSVVYGDYAVLDSGDFSIHLWKCDDKNIAENTSCYIYVDNVDELYTKLKPLNVVHPNGDIEDKFFGLREFAIVDPDGNLLKFGEPLELIRNR